MHTWQTEYTVGTLKANVVIKIIKKCYLALKNATSASKFKKLIYQFLLNKKKKLKT